MSEKYRHFVEEVRGINGVILTPIIYKSVNREREQLAYVTLNRVGGFSRNISAVGHRGFRFQEKTQIFSSAQILSSRESHELKVEMMLRLEFLIALLISI